MQQPISRRGRDIGELMRRQAIHATSIVVDRDIGLGMVDDHMPAERWREGGGSDLAFVTMRLGLDTAAAHLDYALGVKAVLDQRFGAGEQAP